MISHFSAFNHAITRCLTTPDCPNVQTLFLPVKQNGRSPLLLAAERGHTAAVRVLLENSARVDVFDEVRQIKYLTA